MMVVWIVWSDRPIAVFSSEERARNYIVRNKAEMRWACGPACLNAESLAMPESFALAQSKNFCRHVGAHY
jgi:hypothetical protein